MSIEATTSSGIAIAKTAWYVWSIALFQYLNIPTEQFWILWVLMLIDFITWIGKQYRVDKREIKSHLAWLGAMKKIATLTSVLSVALIIKWLGIDDTKYVNAILGIFIMAEGYSTIQNVYAIRTGNILPEFDVISILLKTIWEYMKQRIESAIKNPEWKK